MEALRRTPREPPRPGGLRKGLLCMGALVVILSAGAPGAAGLSPSIKGLTNLRRELRQGEDLLLTCMVRDAGAYTVVWARIARGVRKILTIDKIRVHKDPRISVLHDEAPKFNSSVIIPGGDVWVLSVKNVTEEDSGGYSCRVNMEPPAQIYYMVEVKGAADSEREVLRSGHNYTSCCVAGNVEPQCLGFCTLHDILEGRTGIEPEKCESQFPTIVRCMADFRDHRDCCQKQGIPDICQDLCRGEYTIQEDYVKSHFSCSTFTKPTLLCISEGIELLPMPPRSPSVEVLDPFSLRVDWELPREDSPPVHHFLVNVTTLVRFEPPTSSYSSYAEDANDTVGEVVELDAQDDFRQVPEDQTLLKVPWNATSIRVGSLTPMTWYEVRVTSVNDRGSSMTPYTIRALTAPLTTGNASSGAAPLTPELPDIVGCCIDKGVKHERCLQNLCNPTKRYIDEPDMIVCAAWAQETFSCLTGGVDQSSCCRSRGLPELCVQLCSGNVTKIDYNYFRCVDYFSDFRSCLLQGYGVLPSPPREVTVSNVHPTFALLTWEAPVENAASVSSYHAYYRPVRPSRECSEKTFPPTSGLTYLGLQALSPPRVMEDLCDDTSYEVYVEAFNPHGTSNPSNRILFRTPPALPPDVSLKVWNPGACCRAVNVSPGCQPLCDYDLRMSHYRTLSVTCTHEMASVFRCIVGGRDHGQCCARRGVPVSCLSLCTGSFRGDARTPTACFPYLGNILMCLEEGIGALPGPVTSLHATWVTDGALTLLWTPPDGPPNATYFQVHFQEVDKFSATHAVFKLNNTLNVTEPLVVLKDLKKSALYNIFVVAANEEGTSLPSSILTINASTAAAEQNGGFAVSGVPSAPHSLLLEAKTATSLTILWLPPIVSFPTDRIRYTLHYATLSSLEEEPSYNSSVTSNTALRLLQLTPNTQYIIYVEATNDHGTSRPSETLLAWTDPAYPAFVETPTVHPSNLIVEGGSMTVLCIAMGSPPPKVSLFISGILIHEDVTRHMVTIVKNVSRDMSEISCYADNGYGTPMQSSVSIIVSHRPTITANEEVKVVAGSEVTLKCLVSAWPEPNLLWWEDVVKKVEVADGGNVSIDIKNVSKGNYLMTLKLENAQEHDYYCHASNALGSFTHTLKVRTWKEIKQPLDVSACCAERNVSAACRSACDFDQVDFHKQMNNERCIRDFGKLLECGSDRSDHRGCCSKKGVPAHCLNWCRAKALGEEHHAHRCLLLWAPPIFACFHEGREKLPGPPENIAFKSVTPTSATISWEAPSKNPDKVEKYRVFWREKGTRMALKNDTARTSLSIHNLTEGVAYEVAVKAGNRLGTSVLTETRIFTHRLPYIYFLSTANSNPTGVAVGVCFGVLLVVVVAGIAWWGVRRRQLLAKGAGGISFENPSYVREQNGDAVQITETHNGSLTNGRVPGHGAENGAAVWNTARHDVPGFEPDLDSKGGYKRFKS